MQIVTRVIVAVGVLACLVASALQANAKKPPTGPGCEVINGACVAVSCTECGPAYPAVCTCLD